MTVNLLIFSFSGQIWLCTHLVHIKLACCENGKSIQFALVHVEQQDKCTQHPHQTKSIFSIRAKITLYRLKFQAKLSCFSSEVLQDDSFCVEKCSRMLFFFLYETTTTKIFHKKYSNSHFASECLKNIFPVKLCTDHLSATEIGLMIIFLVKCIKIICSF